MVQWLLVGAGGVKSKSKPPLKGYLKYTLASEVKIEAKQQGQNTQTHTNVRKYLEILVPAKRDMTTKAGCTGVRTQHAESQTPQTGAEGQGAAPLKLLLPPPKSPTPRGSSSTPCCSCPAPRSLFDGTRFGVSCLADKSPPGPPPLAPPKKKNNQKKESL